MILLQVGMTDLGGTVSAPFDFAQGRLLEAVPFQSRSKGFGEENQSVGEQVKASGEQVKSVGEQVKGVGQECPTHTSTLPCRSTSVTCCFRPNIPTSQYPPDEGGWTLAIPT